MRSFRTDPFPGMPWPPQRNRKPPWAAANQQEGTSQKILTVTLKIHMNAIKEARWTWGTAWTAWIFHWGPLHPHRSSSGPQSTSSKVRTTTCAA